MIFVDFVVLPFVKRSTVMYIFHSVACDKVLLFFLAPVVVFQEIIDASYSNAVKLIEVVHLDAVFIGPFQCYRPL